MDGDDSHEPDEAPPSRPRGRRRSAAMVAIAVLLLDVGGGIAAVNLLGHRGREVVAKPPPPPVQLYAVNDPWQAYLADERTCPGGEDAHAPLARQAQTMVCLINFARARASVATLAVDPRLSHSSELKSEEIQRCQVFAHAPCGGDAGDVAREAGYEGLFGENLYVADGPLGAPRVALDGWLNSQAHRENLFRPQWRVHSLVVVKLDRFREYRNATLWVSQFGDR